MKFLVRNYSCLQNPWLRGYRPQIPVLSVLCPQLNLLNPLPPPKKIPGYATEEDHRNCQAEMHTSPIPNFCMSSLSYGSVEFLSDNRRHVRNKKSYKLAEQGARTHTHTHTHNLYKPQNLLLQSQLRASYKVTASFGEFYGSHFVMRFIESHSPEEVSWNSKHGKN